MKKATTAAFELSGGAVPVLNNNINTSTTGNTAGDLKKQTPPQSGKQRVKSSSILQAKNSNSRPASTYSKKGITPPSSGKSSRSEEALVLEISLTPFSPIPIAARNIKRDPATMATRHQTKQYTTASHYMTILDTLEDEQLQCYYSFLLFPPGQLIAVRDISLVTGFETSLPAPIIDENADAVSITPLEKVLAICFQLEQKGLLLVQKDRCNSKLGTSYKIEKDLHESVLLHFKANVTVPQPTGVFLLIALSRSLIETSDDKLDEEGEAVAIIERLAVDSVSNVWERNILTNGCLLRFFYGKYPRLAKLQNPGGRTALSMMASISTRHDPIKFIYEAFPDTIKLADKEGRTVLSRAAEHGFISIVKCLYHYWPEGIEVLDQHNRSPLFYATIGGHLKSAEFLYEMCPTVFQQVDKKTGRDIMSFACSETDSLPLVQLFYEHHSSAIRNADADGKTPLLHAAANGRVTVALYLAEIETDLLNHFDKDGRSAFSHAAENGDYQLVSHLYGLNPNGVHEVDKFGRTALSYAAASGHFDSAQFVYDHNPDAIILPDDYGRYPVFWAVKSGGNLGLARFLYDCYPNVIRSSDQQNGQTAFLAAAQSHRNIHMMKFLYDIDEEAVKTVDNDRRTALSYAVEYNDKVLITYLNRLYPEAVRIEDNNGHLPIWFAVVAGNFELVDYLYALYPESAIVVDKGDGNKTLLSLAAERGYQDIVQFLFGRCPPVVQEKDTLGRTALAHAIINDHLHIVKYLVRVYKAGLQDVDLRGRNALTISLELRGCNYELIQFLYEKWPEALEMPDANGECAYTLARGFRLRQNVRDLLSDAAKKRDIYGKTPFFRAVVRGHATVAKALLDIFPDAIGLTDFSGKTAFFSAAESGEVATLSFLLEIDPEAIKFRDKAGRTPLYIAAKEGRLEAAKFLYESWSAAYDLSDNTERTPMIIAQQRSHSQVVDYFKRVTAPPVDDVIVQPPREQTALTMQSKSREATAISIESNGLANADETATDEIDV